MNIYIFMVQGYWFPDEVQTVLRELFQVELEVETANIVVVVFDPEDRLSIFQLEDLSRYIHDRYRPTMAERQAQNPVDFEQRHQRFLQRLKANE